jgi:hypothetical protein
MRKKAIISPNSELKLIDKPIDGLIEPIKVFRRSFAMMEKIKNLKTIFR